MPGDGVCSVLRVVLACRLCPPDHTTLSNSLIKTGPCAPGSLPLFYLHLKLMLHPWQPENKQYKLSVWFKDTAQGTHGGYMIKFITSLL